MKYYTIYILHHKDRKERKKFMLPEQKIIL